MIQRLQHVFSNKSVLITEIIFKNTSPLLNVEKIAFFKEEGVSGNWLHKQFRYSWDNNLWSAWNTLTQQALINIPFNDRENFYLEIKYTRDTVLSADINEWYLYYDAYVTIPSDDTTTIDADLLQGQPGLYYLWRPNHIGPYTDLRIANLPLSDACTGGVYSHQIDTCTGTTFYLKSIGGGGGISVTDVSDGDFTKLLISTDISIGDLVNVGDGDASVYAGDVAGQHGFREIRGGAGLTVSTSENTIILDSSGGGTYNTTLDSSLTMLSGVGGIPAGTTVDDLYGDDLVSMWDDLLFPTVNPTYVNPSSTFSDNVSNLQIINDEIDITYTTNFNRGEINTGSTFQDYRSGLPSGYYFTDPSANTLLVDVSSSLLSNSQTTNGYVVNIGYQDWTAYVDYLEGPQPYDNKGNPYGAPLSAGSTSVDTLRIEGVYPIKATTVSIDTLTEQSLYSMLTANNITFTMVAESGGYKQRFHFPYYWHHAPTSRPIQGIQTYNTVSGSWEYQGGDATSSLTFWTRTGPYSDVTTQVSYYFYTYNSDNRDSAQIRLVF